MYKRQEQKAILKDLAEGHADIVIATHRLLSKDVSFKDLGLLVIDEEQRFGVDHKEMTKALSPSVEAVSYTHLDVYKRQLSNVSGFISCPTARVQTKRRYVF